MGIRCRIWLALVPDLTIDKDDQTREGMMQGYVLSENDGEHMFQRSGEVVIKIDPTRGSHELCLGTQRMPARIGVPRHVQTSPWTMNLCQSRRAQRSSSRRDVGMGSRTLTRNCSSYGPPRRLAQEEFFRAISSKLGVPPKNLSREDVLAIRHQVEDNYLRRVQSQA